MIKTRVIGVYRQFIIALSKKDRRFELVFLTVAVLAVCFSTSLVIAHNGWPNNPDEGLRVIFRVEAYADHLKHGDFLPVWSSGDALGYGSPTLLYYHKVFYYLSSIFYLITGYMKLALFMTISGLMLVSVYGMRLSLEKFTSNRLAIVSVSMLSILANYTFTDWLYRGAFSEFAAMMVLPWLIWWCINLLESKQFSYSIVMILPLIFYSHNVIGMFSGLLLLVAIVIFFSDRTNKLQTYTKKLLVSVGLIAITILPYLLLITLFRTDYNPSKITQNGFKASQNFVPIMRNFMPGRVNFSGVNTPNVNIDIGTSLALLVIIGGVIVNAISKRRQLNKIGAYNKTAVFLVTSSLLFFLLQLKISRPIYRAFSPLEYLQFPWRLMVFLVPLLILLVAYKLTRIRSAKIQNTVVLIWCSTFIICAPIFYSKNYGYIPATQLKPAEFANTNGGYGLQMTGYGEFLPKVYSGQTELGSIVTVKQYEAFYKDFHDNGGIQGSCLIDEMPKTSPDSTNLEFNIACLSDSEIKLPISYNRYSKIINLSNNKIIDYSRMSSDPRMIIRIGRTKGTIIRVELPTTVRIIRTVL